MLFPGPVPVAASTVLAHLLDGAPQPLTVVGSGRVAWYASTPAGDLVAVVSPQALAPACSLVLPPGVAADLVVPPALDVRIGGGAVHVGGTARLVVGRWWAPCDVTPRAATRTPCPASLERLRGLLAGREDLRADLGSAAARVARAAAAPAADAACRGDHDAAAAALVEVLGLGPGLTPSGDDVAAGVLLALRAALGASPELDRLGARLAHAARDRTTAVSAALLAHAARGRAAAVVTVAVSALFEVPSPGHPDPFVPLLRVGHSSGADLATGALAVADALLPVPHVDLRRSA